MTETPMFPLGSVLMPTMVLPLHIFEPRYRVMMRRCVDDDLQFGVTLIERGHEVGGGDVRTDVGCLARLVAHEEYPDGRWGVMAVGTTRIRVSGWLPDDPYPSADVEVWPDTDPHGDLSDLATTVELAVRELLGVALERGLTAARPDVAMSDDPLPFSYQASAVAPLGPLDRYRLLCCPGPAERLHLLLELVLDARVVLDTLPGDPA